MQRRVAAVLQRRSSPTAAGRPPLATPGRHKKISKIHSNAEKLYAPLLRLYLFKTHLFIRRSNCRQKSRIAPVDSSAPCTTTTHPHCTSTIIVRSQPMPSSYIFCPTLSSYILPTYLPACLPTYALLLRTRKPFSYSYLPTYIPARPLCSPADPYGLLGANLCPINPILSLPLPRLRLRPHLPRLGDG